MSMSANVAEFSHKERRWVHLEKAQPLRRKK
jgi:hypothetical protein